MAEQTQNTGTIKKKKGSKRGRSGAYPDGGVLRGRDECLAALAELAVKHGLRVPRQSG